MILGVFHTAISVTNMHETLHFYCDILGGKHLFTIEQPPKHPYIESVLFPNGTFLEFFYPDSSHPLGQELGHNHFSLITDDIFQTEALLKKHQVTILSSPKVVRDQNWQLWCLDPDGYRVEIMQLSPDCPQRNPDFSYTILK